MFTVVKFTPLLRDRKAGKPDSLNTNEWLVLREFFSKHRNRFFHKGLVTKPRYKVSETPEEPAIFHLEYTKDGVLVPNRVLALVWKEKALDILRGIHRPSEGVCKVVGLHSLVKQFNLRFFCNGIRQLAREFLKSCPDCQLRTPFPTISPPLRPIRSYGPFERLQADLIDMAPGQKRSFMTKNRGQYRYILVIKDCFSKFCWLIPAKTKSADEIHSILHNFFYYDEGAPKYLQTDNGSEFIAEVIKNLCASLGVKIIHGKPYHPESQGQVENLNKRVKKKIAKMLCQRSADDQAKLWPYLLPRVAREINTTWHHTIRDVPFKVFKGRSSVDFYYPVDEEFFDDEKMADDNEFCDEDLQSEYADGIKTQTCEVESNPEEEENGNGSHEPLLSFSDRLEIGCSLSRIREETRLRALEATEHMIANNTRRRFRVSDERVPRFSVGEVVFFKDPDSKPAKVKKNAKDPFKVRNVIGEVKERRALNFYRVQWKKNGKPQVSTLYAGMMQKFHSQKATVSHTEETPTSSLTHQDIADEVSTFAYLFRVNHKTKREKNVLVLEDVEKEMQELWLALDAGVVASIISAEAGDCEEVRDYQCQYEEGISSLVNKAFSFFLIGSVLWEKERIRCPDQLFEVLDNTQGSVVRLHEGECGSCLAADVCTHSCCHDWFLDIGHRLRIIEDNANNSSDSDEEKESKTPSKSETIRESIFSYSTTDQIEDSSDPLLYGKTSGKLCEKKLINTR